ncbi:MAG: PQQ-binding-like beta-propeller repeat protein [Sedimentisphaerales bacterium]|nr:PQQ-binding-like beta-propeller repeat protein [Sedimentisphaerales bacterium]
MERKKMTGVYKLVMVFGFLSFCVTAFSTACAADWPNWRGPNYNGISGETGFLTSWPKEGPKVLWKASIGTGFSSMAVSKGHVYAMGNINDRDILYCFDADKGTEIWKQSYPCPLFDKNHEGGPSATPTVDGDAVYVFSKNGDCLRFEAATGKVVWHKNITKELGLKQPTWYFASSPFIIDNLIILNAGTMGTALNKTDGSLVWENGKGAASYATAVPFTIGGQKCVAIVGAREIFGLIAATGKVIWKLPWKTDYDINAAEPIISGDEMFVSSGYNTGCAFFKIEPNDLTEIWRNKNMRNHINSSVLWEGFIYGFDGQAGGGGKLVCLDYKTGQMKWSQKGMDTGSLCLADGKLVILSEDGKLVIAEASPQGFKELASTKILTGKCWTVPVLANGRIYARNADGQLVCVDVQSKN